MEQKASKSTLLKYAGVLALLVPLLGAVTTAAFQYMQFVRESRDNNFRLVVEKFASEKPEHRLAAATNLSVYLQDPLYKQQSMNILVNLIAIELDTNVLSAIKSSFDNLTLKEDKQKIIQKLLALEQSSFTYNSAMVEWERISSIEFEASYKKFLLDLDSLKKEQGLSAEALPISLIAELNNIKKKSNIKGQAERLSSEIAIHGEIIGSIIQSLLNNTLANPVARLHFFQNTLNYRAVINAKLINPKIINSAISQATLIDFNLIGEGDCRVSNTTFEFSLISKSVFKNCYLSDTLFSGKGTAVINSVFSESTFRNVFFYGANISNSDFRQVYEIRPEFFYGSLNYDQAQFSDVDFVDKIKAITPEQFINFVSKADLSNQRYRSLCQHLFDAEGLNCL